MRMPIYRKNSGKAYLYLLRELRGLHRCLQYSGGYIYNQPSARGTQVTYVVGWSCATAYSNMRHMCAYS